jgi:hypothetical protein
LLVLKLLIEVVDFVGFPWYETDERIFDIGA